MNEVEKVGLVMGLVSYLNEGLACISVHAVCACFKRGKINCFV